MEFDTYQTLAKMTAVYPGKDTEDGLYYSILGLAAEAGEVAGKLAKIRRGDGPLVREQMMKELGDCLWMISAAASDMQVSLEDIASANIQKLRSRQERGVLKGSGDNR